MGNCFASNKILTEDEPQSSCKEMENVAVLPKLEEADEVKVKNNVKKKRKKVVRFKLNEGDSDDDGSGKQQCETKNGAVRIRLVVTQEELKQIILSSGKGLKQPSMEQLIRVVKLRGVRVSEGGRTSGDDDGGWRPALESIPEEH